MVSRHTGHAEDPLTTEPVHLSLTLPAGSSPERLNVPAGKSIVDLVAGVAYLPDGRQVAMSGNLASLNALTARTMTFWADQDVNLSVANESKASGRLTHEQMFYTVLHHLVFTRLELDSSDPFSTQMHFGVHDLSYWEPRALTSHMERFGTLTTTDSFVAVLWTPSTGGSSQYLPTRFRVSSLRLSQAGQKSLEVHNTGDNPAIVRVVGRVSFSEAFVPDAETTGEEGVRVEAGESVLLESNYHFHGLRLEGKSALAGLPTTLSCQFIGTTWMR